MDTLRRGGKERYPQINIPKIAEPLSGYDCDGACVIEPEASHN